MKKIREILRNIFFITIGVFLGIAVLSVIYNYFHKWGIYYSNNILVDKNVWFLLAYISVIGSTYLISYLLENKLCKKKEWIYRFFIVLITFLIRLIVVCFLKTQPVSDFLRVYNFATLFPLDKNTTEYIQFYENAKMFPYYGIESLTMRFILRFIGGTVFRAQMINVTMSCVVSYLLYRILCRLIKNSHKAMNIALLYTFYPSAILNDTFFAHENYHILFSALFLWTIIKILDRQKEEQINKQTVFFILAGISLGILNLYKPIKSIYLLSFLLIYILNQFDQEERKKYFRLFIIILIVSSMCYKGGVCALERYIGTETKTMASRSILIGLNPEEQKDKLKKMNILFEKYVNSSKSNMEVNKKVYSYLGVKWKENKDKIIPMLLEHYNEDWGNEEGYAYWAFQGIETNKQELINSCYKGIIWVIDLYAIYIYVGVIITSISVIKQKNFFLEFNLSIIFLVGMMLLIIEAQARYKSIIFVPLCICGGYGWASMIKREERK